VKVSDLTEYGSMMLSERSGYIGAMSRTANGAWIVDPSGRVVEVKEYRGPVPWSFPLDRGRPGRSPESFEPTGHGAFVNAVVNGLRRQESECQHAAHIQSEHSASLWSRICRRWATKHGVSK
jgi:hypothetical protein